MRYGNYIKLFFACLIFTMPIYAFAGCPCEAQEEPCPPADTTTTNTTTCTDDTGCTEDDNTPVCSDDVKSTKGDTLQATEDNITKQVQDLFANEDDLPAITVTTANGVVFLSGVADNQAQIDKATALAASVDGVTQVDTAKFYVQ